MRRPLLFAVLVPIGCGPRFDPAPFERLREPAIRDLPDLRVIEVEAGGATSREAAGKAIGLLFRTWYGLDAERSAPVAPRARWSEGDETGTAPARARFALPVPDAVQALDDPPTADGLTPRLTTWTYGATAEILHVGSYASEGPAIARLKEHIAAEGCVVAGDHEEEYLKGPGMFFAGDPDGYHTFLRYPVRCASPEPAPVEPTPPAAEPVPAVPTPPAE
jgi:hypothetical protein